MQTALLLRETYKEHAPVVRYFFPIPCIRSSGDPAETSHAKTVHGASFPIRLAKNDCREPTTRHTEIALHCMFISAAYTGTSILKINVSIPVRSMFFRYNRCVIMRAYSQLFKTVGAG